MQANLKTLIIGVNALAAAWLQQSAAHPRLENCAIIDNANTGTNSTEPRAIHDLFPALRSISKLYVHDNTSISNYHDYDLVVICAKDALSPKAKAMLETAVQTKQTRVLDMSSVFEARLEPALALPYRLTLPDVHAEPLLSGDGYYLLAVGYLAQLAHLLLAPVLQAAVPARGDIIMAAQLPQSQQSEQRDYPKASPNPSLRPVYPLQHPQVEQLQSLLSGHFPLHLSSTVVPLARGILLHAHIFLPDGYALGDVESAYRHSYHSRPFVRFIPARQNPQHLPDPHVVLHSNFCDISLAMDNASGHVRLSAAMDEYGKGSVGTMLQSLNLVMGWQETLGFVAAV